MINVTLNSGGFSQGFNSTAANLWRSCQFNFFNSEVLGSGFGVLKTNVSPTVTSSLVISLVC